MTEYPTFLRRTEERLLRYAAIGTQSREDTDLRPTSACQRELAKLLYEELRAMGVHAEYDEAHCVVYGRLPAAHVREDRPVALIAHMDTAPGVKADGVKPWVLRAYPGGDIVLNREQNIVMAASDYPELARYVGQDLILTDGTTLLGGDDKAAIAALMTLAEYYAGHPEAPHRTVCLAFTPDEEVGGLARDLDPERLGARFAYTVDCDHLGWYQTQTFTAARATVTVAGRSVHSATAKGIMINAAELACEFLAALPRLEKPQYTSGDEGFYFLTDLRADVERAELHLFLRDFDAAGFLRRIETVRAIARRLNEGLDRERVTVEIEQEYRNMGEVLAEHPFLVEDLKAAIRAVGLEPKTEPFRGGTDGAALSFRGIPCPNLSAGYENAHSRFEYVPVPSMAKNVEILLKLTQR